MKLKGKKILVSGGAGFIGSHLVDALIKKGCYVRVLDNLSNGTLRNLKQHKDNRNFKFVLGSVVNPRDITESFMDIDIVFHLACLGVRHSIRLPFENHRVNAEGTFLVLAKARECRVKKFIYCSSSEVYGTAEYIPMPESHPLRPSTVYGASKLAGEVYTGAYNKTYGLKTVVVRPFNTYGPRSHHEQDAGEMIPKSIVRLLNNKPILIFGDGAQTRDYTYVEDIAEGLVKAAESDDLIGLTLNLGSGFEVTIKTVAESLSRLLGVPQPKIRYLKNRPADVLRLYADLSAFNKITHWKPRVSFEEGLLKTIRWFKSRPEGPATLLKEEKAINWE